MLAVLPEEWTFSGAVQVLNRTSALQLVRNSTHGCTTLPDTVRSALLIERPSSASFTFPANGMSLPRVAGLKSLGLNGV